MALWFVLRSYIGFQIFARASGPLWDLGSISTQPERHRKSMLVG